MQIAHQKFDVTDVRVTHPPVDTTDAILDVAGAVLDEYGTEPGASRIERMARWILLNVGEPVTMQCAGGLASFHTSRIRVVRCGQKVGIDLAFRREFSASESREIAAAFIRAAELAER